MAEKQVVKFTDSELEQIKQFSSKYQEITVRFGEIEVELTLLDNEVKRLENAKLDLRREYISLGEAELKLSSELRQKYGEGELDIETGLFTKK
jgi:predicted nuclease with TOPRIM domain